MSATAKLNELEIKPLGDHPRDKYLIIKLKEQYGCCVVCCKHISTNEHFTQKYTDNTTILKSWAIEGWIREATYEDIRIRGLI